MPDTTKLPNVTLLHGHRIPALGFGTWQLAEGEETETAVAAAIKAGYRLIDTAKIYGNETSVGLAINSSGIARDEIFITTKLWNSDHGYDQAIKAIEGSLERLGLSEVDLYLIHWPGKDNVGSWKALIDIHKQKGGAKAIGVSNFTPDDLEEIISATGVVPAVNQIEFHPFVYDNQLPTLNYCNDKGIVVEAYSPLARGNQLSNTLLKQIAKEHEKTSAQVMLRWAIQHGTVPIPKSSHPERIKQNLQIFCFELSHEQMEAINNLSEGKTALPL